MGPTDHVQIQPDADEKGTSLARFLRTRGPDWLGGTASRPSYRIQIAVGSGLLAVPLVMGIAVLLGANPEILIYGAGGPTIAGVINLAVGLTLRNKALRSEVTPVSLSKEAKSMLSRLVHAQTSWSFRPRSSETSPLIASLGIEAFEVLERSAFQYNRVVGALTSLAQTSAIVRISPKVLIAANEAMSEILHNAAMVAEYPEGAKTSRMRIEFQVNAMRELGDHVEQIASRPESLIERMASRTQMSDVLDELRFDELARTELQINSENSEPKRQNQVDL